MRRSWRIVILSFLFFVSIVSCRHKETKHKNYFTLKVILDSDSAFYLDSPSISANYLRSNRIYDTTGRYGFVYQFDSVESGPLTIQLQSQLDTGYSRDILLEKDSSIYIKQSELPLFTETEMENINFTDLIAGEKICIAVRSRGCFHDFTEKSVIRRMNDYYRFDFSSSRMLSYEDWNAVSDSREFGNMLGDSLKRFKSGLLQFLEKTKPKIVGTRRAKDGSIVNILTMSGGSTTTTWYRIQKGKYVYNLTNSTGNDSTGYYTILKTIRPEWFKETEQ